MKAALGKGGAMRVWLWGAVAALALGAADWGAGALLAQGARAALADLAARGQGGAEAVAAMGFPGAIGVDVRGLSLRDEGAGWGWLVPQASVTAHVWSPLDWRADLALPQRVIVAGNRFALSGAEAALKVDLGLGPALPVAQASLNLSQAALTYEAASAPSLASQSIEIDIEKKHITKVYALSGRVFGLSLPPRLAASLSPQAHLSDRIETITLRADLGFTAPLSLLSDTSPELISLDLTEARLVWDGHVLAAAGELVIASDGMPEGTITLAIGDVPVWIELAVSARILPPERRDMLATMGAYLTAQSDDGMARVPLSFEHGRMSLAAIPLGPAPRLRQRQ